MIVPGRDFRSLRDLLHDPHDLGLRLGGAAGEHSEIIFVGQADQRAFRRRLNFDSRRRLRMGLGAQFLRKLVLQFRGVGAAAAAAVRRGCELRLAGRGGAGAPACGEAAALRELGAGGCGASAAARRASASGALRPTGRSAATDRQPEDRRVGSCARRRRGRPRQRFEGIAIASRSGAPGRGRLAAAAASALPGARAPALPAI